uniref:Pradc1-like isoform 2 n=1 Tax=Tortanus forcipatus TaxID=197020 RepID=A0A0U2T948_9MAXI|nr:pradc1-like isoform 2 [Tortanus forcipatus]
MIPSSAVVLLSTCLSLGLTNLNLDTEVGNSLTEEEYKMTMGKGYIFFEILEPEDLAYTYKSNPASFAPGWNETMMRIPLVPTDPACGCGYIRNQEDIEGRIALIDRGDCSFVSKVVRAEEAGARGVIITDQDAENDELYISMVDDTTERKVNIPAAFLLGKNGQIIKSVLRKMSVQYALINVPVNISSIPIHKLDQPPWLVW